MSNIITTENVNTQLPAHIKQTMDAGGELGTELLTQYIQPPRIKLVQPQSSPPYSDRFNQGDVICVPQMSMIAPVILNAANKPTDKGNLFFFIPIFFYPEFCVWNPLQLKGQLPTIRERTQDAKSVIARKSQSPGLREEPCPEDGKYVIRYVEHLNFVVTLINHELFGTPLIMSFARSEHKTGAGFATLIKMRRAPMFGCQFQANSAERSNNQGRWFGLDIANPQPVAADGNNVVVGPWVDSQELYEFLASEHATFKAAHAAGQLQADYDDESANTVEGAAAVNVQC